ncbi:RNA recognition motif domain protein [Ophiocordyceps sinensis CO18]|uniref:RNA recognition motif domain protein n=1 Tax=Ophiocordyceps sinensis (strain Co18 / CGMCC 3.14243) TaxID=911162 RepID=T5A6I5_OPHSC|nr:RNA recognition motif domain protein [Ophiocordyceps sinensis CO18]
MPRNETPENTIMRDVPAGDESGIYYIIMSGLPFATIWQLLKDWLRQAGCDVDHIEVFQKSTSGWIRLMGKENFERALHHLQTVPYNNRLLLYLDKNRTESVKIMELIDDPPPRPKLGGSSRAARSRSRFRAQHNASLGDPELGRPQATPCTNYPAGPTTTSPAFEAPPAMCYRGALTESPRAQNVPREGYGVATDPFLRGGWSLQYGSSGYRPFEQPGHPASPRRDSDAPGRRHVRFDGVANRQPKPPSRTGSATSLSDSGQKVQHGSECFKVQIISLRQWASAGDVEEWVRHSMGEWASAMSRIDVPSDHQKDCIRGSGYITFLSSAAAKRAVELLNQKPFLGRVVCARLA